MNTLITLINENGTWRKQVENAATCDQNDHMAHIRLKLMMRWENKLLKEEEERKTKEVSCDAPTLEFVGVSCASVSFNNAILKYSIPRFYSYDIYWPSILRIFFEPKKFIKTTVWIFLED
jgi:hypothetical protein